MNVILCCSAGMSTSLFVQKMVDHAQSVGEIINIIAIPIAELDEKLKTMEVDLVAIAPQIRFQKESIESKTDKPVFIIEMRDYGMMNVAKVLPDMKAAVNK